MLRNVIAFVAVATAAPLAAEPIEVLPTGHPIAMVQVEGRGPYRFIIDTGASNTNLLPRLRAQLPELRRRDAGRPLNGAGGAVETETVKLGRLTAHGRTFLDLPAFVLPAGPVDELGVDGVLGADVLSTYAMEIDIPGKRWSLAEKPTPAMMRGMLTPVPITLDEARAPRLTVMINGRPVPALLDTGARGTIINWAAARLVGIAPDDPRLTSGGAAKGVTARATSMKAAVVEELRIGDYARPAPKLHIADLPIFEAIGMADGPAVLLGIDAFTERRFVIDHAGGRLLIAAER
jgi:predicted aspartyl protease